jgi:hypothetical protein
LKTHQRKNNGAGLPELILIRSLGSAVGTRWRLVREIECHLAALAARQRIAGIRQAEPDAESAAGRIEDVIDD